MKTISLVLLTLLCICLPVCAQPVIEDVQIGDNDGSTTTTSTATLTPTGSDRAIVALWTAEGNPDKTITGIVYAGSEAFSNVVISGGPTGFMRVEIWYLADPSAGTGVVTATHTASGATVGLTAIALSSAQQTSPTLSDTEECTSACDSTYEVSLTTTVAQTLLLTAAAGTVAASTFTHGTGQNEQSDFTAGGGHSSSTSAEVKAIAGVETLTSTVSSSTTQSRYAAIGVEPSAGGVPPARRRKNMQFR